MKKPIVCPKCNSEEIAITVQYKKATAWKVLKFTCLLLLVATVIFNMAEVIDLYELDKNAQIQTQEIVATAKVSLDYSNGAVGIAEGYIAAPLIAFFLCLAFVFGIAQYIAERKTIIHCVCKNCQNHWTIEEDNDIKIS